jgi:hypothetical protein
MLVEPVYREEEDDGRVRGDGGARESGQEAATREQLALRVKRLVPGGAADLSGGIAVGDLLLAVDGAPVAALPLAQLASHILGLPGSAVNLTVPCPPHPPCPAGPALPRALLTSRGGNVAVDRCVRVARRVRR